MKTHKKGTGANASPSLITSVSAARAHADALPNVLAEQLEAAIDVARRRPKDQVDQHVPAPPIESLGQTVGAFRAIADHQIAALLDRFQEMIQLAHVVLPVSRRDQNEVESSAAEGRRKRGCLVGKVAFE